jgi:hypothetical protein
MRILTLVQAVADGVAAAGLVLFALLITDIGSAPLAITGLALLGASVLVRVLAVMPARRRLVRVEERRRSWRPWVLALWCVEGGVFVAGVVLAHSPTGATGAAGIAGAVVAIASAALAGGAARRVGRDGGFVDSASVSAYA